MEGLAKRKGVKKKKGGAVTPEKEDG